MFKPLIAYVPAYIITVILLVQANKFIPIDGESYWWVLISVVFLVLGFIIGQGIMKAFSKFFNGK